MSKRLPPLNWLRSFEAAARHLNFTVAAQELNLTQAAVSKHVNNLEANLGVTLFNRLARGLELTKSGAAYLPAVHDAIERLASATDELFGYGRAKTLKLRVSLIFFNAWLAPKLGDFKAKHPAIDLRFSTTIWADERDLDCDADMEIKYGRADWSRDGINRLTWDTLFPVCSPHLLAQSPALSTPDDLKDHTLLHAAGYEEGWGNWLKHAQAKDLSADRGWHFDTLLASLDMAERGLGVALARSSLVAESLKSGRLVAPFEAQVATDEAFYLVCDDSQKPDSQHALFRLWLLDQVQQSSALAQAELDQQGVA